jgi:hypothetical protein
MVIFQSGDTNAFNDHVRWKLSVRSINLHHNSPSHAGHPFDSHYIVMKHFLPSKPEGKYKNSLWNNVKAMRSVIPYFAQFVNKLTLLLRSSKSKRLTIQSSFRFTRSCPSWIWFSTAFSCPVILSVMEFISQLCPRHVGKQRDIGGDDKLNRCSCKFLYTWTEYCLWNSEQCSMCSSLRKIPHCSRFRYCRLCARFLICYCEILLA